MNSPAAIEASVAAFLLRCVLVGWLCCWIFLVVDRRKSAWGYQVMLGAGTALFALRAFLTEETYRLAWGTAALAGLIWTLVAVRHWLATAPAEVHAESSVVPVLGSRARKAKAGKNAKRPTAKIRSSVARNSSSDPASAVQGETLGSTVTGIASWVTLSSLLFAVGIVASVIPLWPMASSLGTFTPVHWIVPVHLFASSGMFALSIVIALELTVLSSPDSVLKVGGVTWHRLAMASLILASMELLVSLVVFLEYTDQESASTEELVVKRVFALALLVSAMIVWYIPHRLTGFQRRSELPTGWGSLAISGWIAVLAFAVVCILPLDWPLL